MSQRLDFRVSRGEVLVDAQDAQHDVRGRGSPEDLRRSCKGSDPQPVRLQYLGSDSAIALGADQHGDV